MIIHLTNYTLHLGIKKNTSVLKFTTFAKSFNSENLLWKTSGLSNLTLVFVEKIGRIHVVRSTIHV